MQWSPDFPIRRGKNRATLAICVYSTHVWAGVDVAGQLMAFDSTHAAHNPRLVVIYGDCICIGAHFNIERGLMRPIVDWLRDRGIEIEVDNESSHAADLAHIGAVA